MIADVIEMETELSPPIVGYVTRLMVSSILGLPATGHPEKSVASTQLIQGCNNLLIVTPGGLVGPTQSLSLYLPTIKFFKLL